MGKAKGKHRLDKFYHLAKEQGYRSRAAFKIVQLDAKFSFFSSARSLLDLCAAPGGWMQVAVKHMPVGSLIMGVDLVPIRPIRGAFSLQEDITTPKCKASIRKLMKENGCNMLDVVLHDGSPNVGGAWSKEATTQASLVVDALKLAVEFLAPKGTFVSKVFRSQDYNAILYCFKQLFEKVEVTKPVASRSTSAEIYVVGLRYKAPAKIDPRLLDVKHLFQQVVDPPKVVDVLRGSKQKRNREGYEEGLATIRKIGLASDFVCSDKPLEVLGSVTSISFEDPACSSLKDHSLTTDEIKLLCDDLRVLGKQEFKLLLKWRLHIRKALSPQVKNDSGVDEVSETVEGDDDERMLGQMEELHSIYERKKKKAKKLLAKRRAKARARTRTGMKVDVMEDGYNDYDLFSLSSIKAKKDLLVVDSPAQSDDQIDVASEDEANGPKSEDSEASDVDSDEERRRYDEELENCLDRAYERFVAAKEGSTKKRKRAKLINDATDSEVWKDNGTYHLVRAGQGEGDDMSITIIDRLCKPSPVVLCYLMEEEEQPLLSNPNYRRWRLLLDVTKLATGSRTDGPINSDINSPNVRTPVTPNIRTPVTPAGRAKQAFLYGISSPPTAEDGYTQFMPRSRSDLTAASSLADESQQISLKRNASGLGEGISRENGRDSLVINVDDDEKFPARGKRRKLPRSSSAPAMVALSRIPGADAAMATRPELSSASSIVRQAVIGVVIYLSIGVGIYMWRQKEFKGKKTFPFVDGLYFCIVTMCTIGYGDIVPDSTWTKVFICLFILVGFGFIDILLSGLVTYVLDKQETVLLLSAEVQGNRYEAANRYIIDVEKGRMRIRIKVALALGVVGACTGVGTLVVRSLESLSWLDSFYVTVTSVTTLGYGDYSFDTVEGRVFASIWLLVSTLAVARAFLYLAELRIDRRNRAIAKWVLQREMTVGDLMAADIDNNGSVSKSEFVIYKLKEMGKVEEKDIVAIVKQFNRLDTDNCGKITLSLLSGH